MLATKRRASLEPIRTQRSKTSRKSIGNIERTASTRPALSHIPQTPRPVAHLLPPLKLKPDTRNRSRPSELLKPKKHIQRPTFDEQIISRQQHTRRKSYDSQKQGLDALTLMQRKENHLNTYFNQRRLKLVQITKANRRIYQRINSQTSLYSSRQLDKSFQTSRSLSRRLSLSKLSKLSSRHSIQSLSQSRKTKDEKLYNPPQKRKSIKIEPEDIKTVQVDKMYRYLSIFCNQLNVNQGNQEKAKQGNSQPRVHKFNKENIQTLHKAQLSKIKEQDREINKGRRNLLLARRH